MHDTFLKSSRCYLFPYLKVEKIPCSKEAWLTFVSRLTESLFKDMFGNLGRIEYVH